jgi:hypothetical protein
LALAAAIEVTLVVFDDFRFADDFRFPVERSLDSGLADKLEDRGNEFLSGVTYIVFDLSLSKLSPTFLLLDVVDKLDGIEVGTGAGLLGQRPVQSPDHLPDARALAERLGQHLRSTRLGLAPLPPARTTPLVLEDKLEGSDLGVLGVDRLAGVRVDRSGLRS